MADKKTAEKAKDTDTTSKKKTTRKKGARV